jgi:hypothetical protein
LLCDGIERSRRAGEKRSPHYEPRVSRQLSSESKRENRLRRPPLLEIRRSRTSSPSPHITSDSEALFVASGLFSASRPPSPAAPSCLFRGFSDVFLPPYLPVVASPSPSPSGSGSPDATRRHRSLRWAERREPSPPSHPQLQHQSADVETPLSNEAQTKRIDSARLLHLLRLIVASENHLVEASRRLEVVEAFSTEGKQAAFKEEGSKTALDRMEERLQSLRLAQMSQRKSTGRHNARRIEKDNKPNTSKRERKTTTKPLLPP